jgi:hypothetical protein
MHQVGSKHKLFSCVELKTSQSLQTGEFDLTHC